MPKRTVVISGGISGLSAASLPHPQGEPTVPCIEDAIESMVQRGFSVSSRYGKCCQHHSQSSSLAFGGWRTSIKRMSLLSLRIE